MKKWFITYPNGQIVHILNSRKMMKIMEKSAFLHEMVNIGPTLVQHWYNIIICNRVDRILVRHRIAYRVRLC